jgi:hypothetical protein
LNGFLADICQLCSATGKSVLRLKRVFISELVNTHWNLIATVNRKTAEMLAFEEVVPMRRNFIHEINYKPNSRMILILLVALPY